MNAADILNAFRADGFVLTAEGDRIRIEPGGRLTDEALSLIRANKPALQELLRSAIEPDGDRAPNFEGLDPEGRAAGERILAALRSPRQERAQERATDARRTRRRDDCPEGGTTLPGDPSVRSWRWLLHYRDRDSMEARILPEPTLAEVLAEHPDAIAAEPLPESDRVAQPLSPELDRLIRKVAAFHGFTADELEEALAVASRDVDNALASFRLLVAGVDAFMDIDREAFEERAGILEYDGGYSRPEAELLAAWEVTQALFQRLTAREWLARYAPERLPAGDKPENYPVVQIRPGNDFFLEGQRRGGTR